MTSCYVVQVTTPKKYLLNGLWFGPKRPRRVIVWVHGLGSSMFSKQSIAGRLVDTQTAVLMFNNRGHDVVANLPRKAAQTEKRPQRILAGAAHERFADCVDDIQGAINFTHRVGVKNVYLAGHSTGCQKSMYWAYRKGRGVRGIILLAPVNDYAGALAWHGKKKLERATRLARTLIARGKSHELLPKSAWSEESDDAQRFLSLYTAESIENIFSYDNTKKKPRILRAVKLPLLVLWAGSDEYADRSAARVAVWFKTHLKKRDSIVIVPRVKHGFKGGEKKVAAEIRTFLRTH